MVHPSHPFLIMSSVSLSMNDPSLSLISQSSGFELEELDLGADQFNGNLDAGSEDLEDEEEVHDDNEELEDEEEVHDDNEEGAESIDDHPEKESSIEVDSDDDNMQTKFYKPPVVTSKKRKLRHSLSEAVAENRNNAR